METVLFLAPVDPEAGLARGALEALSAAKNLADGLGAKLVLGAFGADASKAAAAAAGAGAKLLAVTSPELAQARYGTDAAAAEALAKAAGATIVVAPHASRTARVMAGVAQRLGGRVDTHAAALLADGGAPVVSRWFYKQRIEAKLSRPQRPWVVLVDGGAAPAWQPSGAAPAVEAVAASLPAARTSFVGFETPKGGGNTIKPDAKLLFVAGAGWTKKQADGKPHLEEAEQLILGVLEKAKASLGSSKSLADQCGEGQAVLGFMSHLNQVGQTGSSPRHPKGLATCCHGEEPHVVGWRFVNERRAINLDANCGWARGKADVVYVADAFAVVRELNALLDAKK
jgi:electron transfer flavoprotein alpha subunit